MYRVVLALFMGMMASACHAESGNSATPLRACTQMGCESGLTVALPLDYRWQPGNYIFQLQTEQETLRCEGALPFHGCEHSALRCSSETIRIMESGCALPAEAHGFGDIQITGEPEKVRVTITRKHRSQGQKILADESFAPVYQTLQPNGPGCEPICRQGRVELSLER
jgi:hypothetical protein